MNGERRPVAIVLAGGLARRMGGADKALLPLAGQPLLAHVIACLRPQTRALALSANGDPARFAAFGLPVLADPLPGYPGPLAGILAGMRWAAGLGATEILSAPTDTPFLPPDLASRLAAAREREAAPIAAAASNGRVHPVIGLWSVALAAALEADLRRGERRAGAWSASRGMVAVDFPAVDDPFSNVNDPAGLAAAEARLARRPRALPQP
jgi:molybdopterin-guanine dinucleotide biosynthesis protein A